MSALPDKPQAVAHVSDAHWKGALIEVFSRVRQSSPQIALRDANSKELAAAVDYARCLILLNEVPVTVDPIEAAMDAAWDEYLACQSGRGMKFGPDNFRDACRKHFAGLTFPAMGEQP
jgi:hypothetical protein